jgi:hypothetical protein
MNRFNLHSRERGQAIVIIALLMVVLFAFLALAVDGGNLYLHRRMAQNASDAGSMAGAARMLEQDVTIGDIENEINTALNNNGIDTSQPGNVYHAWFIDSHGDRISNNEINTFGYVPIDQGAAGIEVTADTQFTAFVASIFGRSQLDAQANSGAVVIFPNFCADWVFFANCDEDSGNCYNAALNLSGSLTDVSGGGIHSNSGLETTGASFNLQPPIAEWGTPGKCTGNVCPPGGPAYQVPPEQMPIIYRWEDFQPGGSWWVDMCQGAYGEKCHYQTTDISSNDYISAGLWVVDGGNINSPRFFNPAQTHYTFVTSGNVHFNGEMPIWEPFVGSSTRGGSKAFIFTTAVDGGGVDISGSDVSWFGIVYAPNGLTSISASGDQSGDGAVFSWRINLSGANMTVHHDTYWCPPEQAKVTLLW